MPGPVLSPQIESTIFRCREASTEMLRPLTSRRSFCNISGAIGARTRIFRLAAPAQLVYIFKLALVLAIQVYHSPRLFCSGTLQSSPSGTDLKLKKVGQSGEIASSPDEDDDPQRGNSQHRRPGGVVRG